MTGYTVHTGTSKKFVAGWDQIFDQKPAKKTAKKKTATKKAAPQKNVKKKTAKRKTAAGKK